MQIGFEAAVVALFLVLPGFLTYAIQRWILSFRRTFTGSGSDGAWFAMAAALSRSLVLNVAATLGFFGLAPLIGWSESPLPLHTPATDVGTTLSALTVREVAAYLAVLYGFALVAGIAGGFVNSEPLAATLRRLRIIRVAPDANVWWDTLSRSFPKDHPMKAWVRLTVDATDYVGRLRHTTINVDREKPIEAFLNPVYRCVGSRFEPLHLPQARRVGLYVRIGPGTATEIFAAPEDWRPPQPPTPGDDAGSIRAISDSIVYCEGSPEAGGHPGVFLHYGAGGSIACPYCQRRFLRPRPA